MEDGVRYRRRSRKREVKWFHDSGRVVEVRYLDTSGNCGVYAVILFSGFVAWLKIGRK